ncbi:MAG: carboxypeptidase-like regulatory domain-containing protein, partial [Terriglobales bacterium]
MHPTSNRIGILGLVSLALALSLPLTAQTTTGRILGSVTDSTGAAVAGASVLVTDTQRGATRTAATNTSGEFAVPELQPGIYKVRAEAKGFKTVERPNIVVEVAVDLRVDITLPTGQVSETVVVTDEVPLVDSLSSTLGGTLSNAEINDLPLNGRNYENLLQLRPGVVRYPGGGFSTTSTNGLRAEDNAYFIEGLFNSEPYSG